MKVKELGQRKEHLPLLAALADKKADRITMAELTAICYRWSYHYALEDFRKEPLPVPPDYVMTFWRMKPKEQKKFWHENITGRDKVRDFFRDRQSVVIHNRDKTEWLEKMLEFFEERNELEKVGKIREVLRDY
jgi:hypothetical protein